MNKPIATIKKNAREELRVSVDHYQGYELLNLRIWFEADDGSMRPSKKGLALRLELLPELREALEAASREVAA